MSNMASLIGHDTQSLLDQLDKVDINRYQLYPTSKLFELDKVYELRALAGAAVNGRPAAAGSESTEMVALEREECWLSTFNLNKITGLN